MNPDPHDPFLLAHNIHGDRRYIVHTEEPRFIAEIGDDPEAVHSGIEYVLPAGAGTLYNFAWFDPCPPQDELADILRLTASFLAEYESILDEEED